MIRGGQGRTPQEIERDALLTVAYAAAALFVLVLVCLCS